MKKVLFFFLLSLFVPALYAARQNDKKIVVKVAEGYSEYPLGSVRCIKFNNGNVVLYLYGNNSETWLSETVKCMLFDEYESTDETSATGIIGESFRFNGKVLTIESAAPIQVQLFTVEGNLLVDTVCNGSFSLDASAYPCGMYLIVIDGCTYKIINR